MLKKNIDFFFLFDTTRFDRFVFIRNYKEKLLPCRRFCMHLIRRFKYYRVAMKLPVIFNEL